MRAPFHLITLALALATVCRAGVIINPYALATSGPTDPLFAQVVTLLHFDGADGSTGILDSIGNSWTASGGAAISTDQSQFGSASLELDGTNDFLRLAGPGSGFDLGASDFTFDWWFRASNVAISSAKPMWSWRHNDGVNNTQFAANLRSGAIRVTISFNGVTDNTLAAFGTASMSLSNDTWHFCRITRSGSEFKLFVDGTQRGTTYTSATSFSNLARDCYIGKNNLNHFGGFLDDFRVTIGTARDGAEVPAAAFPDA